jgi:hypothetical protein
MSSDSLAKHELATAPIDTYLESLRRGDASPLGLSIGRWCALLVLACLSDTTPGLTDMIVSASSTVGGAISTPAGATPLAYCPGRGSFTEATARAAGMTSAKAVAYYKDIGCRVDGNSEVGWRYAPKEASERSPEPPPPSSRTTAPDPIPSTTTTTTTTTTTLPKYEVIVLAGEEGEDSPPHANTEGSVPPKSYNSDNNGLPPPPSRDGDQPPPPKAVSQPAPDRKRYYRGATGSALAGAGAPPEEVLLGAEVTPGQSILNTAMSQLQSVSGDGSNQDIGEKVMPPGMENEPYCAAFVSSILKMAGYPIFQGNYGNGTLETGALNLMRIFQNSDAKAGSGYKLAFVGVGDVIEGKYDPQPGDVTFYSRAGVGKGHVGIVEEFRRDSGALKSIEGNVNGGRIATTERNLFSSTNGLKFLGVGRVITSDGEASEPLMGSPSDNNSAPVIINVYNQDASPPQEGGFGGLLGLVPEEVIRLVSDVTGRDPSVLLAGATSSGGGTSPEPFVDASDLSRLGSPIAPTGSSSAEREPDANNSNTDPRDMTEEQVNDLKLKLDNLPYKDTTSLEEFLTYYKPLFEMASYLSGAPVEAVAAHASLESNYSNDPERQKRGWPSELFAQHWNPWGIKSSPKDGCRTDPGQSATTGMNTHEGTDGIDRHIESANFCGYLSWLAAAESYANLLALPRYNISPREDSDRVTVAVFIDSLFNGGYMTNKEWPAQIAGRIELTVGIYRETVN